ncbi:MAG: 3-hydroxyacyl-CoA dehydrogenase NAD-binding domain-containing protein [Planctomycetales bacterium]
MWHHDQPDADGILRVRIDREDRPVNALSRAALADLDDLVAQVSSEPAIRGVVFISGKPGNFIAGADVTEFKEIDGTEAAREISEFGQQVFARLEALDKPTVAMISGACLGGGLEFALACRYRIADEDPKTQLGLPEVMLGLVPGWGGTVRLPRLIGLTAALPLVLTGKRLNGFQARSRGLVHDVVPREAFDFVSRRIVRTHLDQGTASGLFRKPQRTLIARLLDGNRFGARLALSQAEKEVLKSTHGHYPAPLKAIDTIRHQLTATSAAAFHHESNAVAELAVHPVTTECLRLFFLQEEAKKSRWSMVDGREIEPSTIERAAVIGAGAMGAGIALLMAKKGIWTRLKDLKPEFVARGVQTVRKLLKGDVQRKRLTPLEAQRAEDRISPTTDYRGLQRADIVIEAVLEDVDIKRQVFAELAEATSPETVLATNTSSLLVSDVARDVPHPERVVGLHFFNPPHKMQLVEIVRTSESSPEAIARAFALVQRLGKTGIVVGDCAGFLVNRLLSPYMNEAGHLLYEVADALEIERAAVEFGMPMGPLELTDLVGLQVASHVARNMHAAYGDRMEPAPVWRRLEQLRLGNEQKVQLIQSTKKGKQLDTGFARALEQLRREQPTVSVDTLSRAEIVKRLVYPVIDEAARCLDEGTVETPEQIDLAMVFGTGFAPFRGGPMRYADAVGLKNVVADLERFARIHPRLEPSEALRRRAHENARFCVPVRENRKTAVA